MPPAKVAWFEEAYAKAMNGLLVSCEIDDKETTAREALAGGLKLDPRQRLRALR